MRGRRTRRVGGAVALLVAVVALLVNAVDRAGPDEPAATPTRAAAPPSAAEPDTTAPAFEVTPEPTAPQAPDEGPAPSAPDRDATPPAHLDATPPAAVPVHLVASVSDGDTLRLADGTRVRLAIADAPEVNQGTECMGPEATAFTERWVAAASGSVTLHRPAGAPTTDPYGRTVAEVRDLDGTSLNVALVGAGLARVDERYTHEDPDLAARLRDAEQQARAAGLGIYSGACTDTAAAPEPVAPLAPAPRSAGCDPAYPTVCIPPPPPDLDCGDLVERRFTVLPPDPHNFDGDGNGVGCER